MKDRVYKALNNEDWSIRLSALVAIQEGLEKAMSPQLLWEIQQGFDREFIEDQVVHTIEVLALRERFCVEVRRFPNETQLWEPILSYYLQDRFPDTYAQPRSQALGPEWASPSKWKVRIEAAYTLGVLPQASTLPTLQMHLLTEQVPLVRRALQLSIVSLQNMRQEDLLSYLDAYHQRDHQKGKDALCALFLDASTSQQFIFQQILQEIGL